MSVILQIVRSELQPGAIGSCLSTLEADMRRITVEGQPGQKNVCETLAQKYLTQKSTGRMAQMVECLQE
jgi:hypothetical protein